MRAIGALLILAGCGWSRASSAQVIELQAGGDTHAGGVATVATFWGPSYDGWIGIGEQDGFRFGGFARIAIGRDTLRIGNDFLALDYPTDVLHSGYSVLMQGATWQMVRGRRRMAIFGGTNASGLGAPLFGAQRAGRGLAGISLTDSVSARIRLHGRLVLSTRQSLTSGIEWRAASRTTAAATFGLGGNRPFAVGSIARRRASYEVLASFTSTSRGYRRAYLAEPARSRLDGLAFAVTVHPTPKLDLSVARQTFLRDSTLGSPAGRATGTSLAATTAFGATHASFAVSEAATPGRTDHSGYASIGRAIGPIVTIDLSLLAVRPQDRPAVVTPILTLREQVSPDFTVEQVLTVGRDQQTLSLGGSRMGALNDVSVGYQIIHAPLLLETPFLRTLYVALRFNVGAYAANVTTTVLPTGETRYTGSLTTYLYAGNTNGPQPAHVTSRLPRYLVQGVVTDESGAPIRGASLTIGDAPLFTDRAGRFFVRLHSRRPLPLVVALDEFTVAGRFELVSAPSVVTPTTDGAATTVSIVVRRRP